MLSIILVQKKILSMKLFHQKRKSRLLLNYLKNWHSLSTLGNFLQKFDNFWRRSLKRDFFVDKNTGIRRVSGVGLSIIRRSVWRYLGHSDEYIDQHFCAKSSSTSGVTTTTTIQYVKAENVQSSSSSESASSSSSKVLTLLILIQII